LQAPTPDIAELAAITPIRAALEWFRKERTWINEQHLKLCRVPSPTFFEQQRAQWMAEQFKSLGWEAKLDRAGNVVGHLPGKRDAPSVAVTAHLDTVLAPRAPEDIKVTGDGRMLGPGVADNGAGLAALLAIAAVWNTHRVDDDAHLSPLLVANVGEEGEGNLNGMRYICRPANAARLRAFLVLDGPNTDHITNRALASRRFEASITGPGGHSWSDYGVGNPVHALSRAVTLFADQAPNGDGPRCSFNFGVLEGGTSINSIPNVARAKVDLRSECAERLDEMAALLGTSLEQAVEAENRRAREARSARVSGKLKEIGSRPGGVLPEEAPILACLRAVDAHLGIRSQLDCSSTDANIPLSLGWSAVSVGAGGQGGGAHTASEWYQPDGREVGLRRILLALCWLLRH
jgi:acetylornithine deacetylase/succinyl-diaminopimelate desuccinylase-like protein